MNVVDTCVQTTVRGAGALALIAAFHSPEPLLAVLFGVVGSGAVLVPHWFVPQETPVAPLEPAPTPDPQAPRTAWAVVPPSPQPWTSRPMAAPAPLRATPVNPVRPAGAGYGPILSERPVPQRTTRF